MGYNVTPTADDRVHIGNSSITWIGGQVAWSTYSDGRFKRNVTENISGLDFIMKLRPVSYNWDIDKLDKYMGIEDSLINKSNMKESRDLQKQKRYIGFIAQEVEKAAKESNFKFSGLQTPVNENTPYSISYAEFVVPLVKAVQEQQKIIKNYEKKIKDLEKRIENLEK